MICSSGAFCLFLASALPGDHWQYLGTMWQGVTNVTWINVKWASWKKGPFVVVFRFFFFFSGMKSYTVIWGLFHTPWNKDPYSTTSITMYNPLCPSFADFGSSKDPFVHGQCIAGVQCQCAKTHAMDDSKSPHQVGPEDYGWWRRWWPFLGHFKNQEGDFSLLMKFRLVATSIIFFMFTHISLGFHDPIWLLHMFQMGWFNHQLELHSSSKPVRAIHQLMVNLLGWVVGGLFFFSKCALK